MSKDESGSLAPRADRNRPGASQWMVGVGVLVILMALFSRRMMEKREADAPESSTGEVAGIASAEGKRMGGRLWRATSPSVPGATAEEIVARKVLQFGRSRHELVRAIARRKGKEIPSEIERFFAALESGNWEEIDAQWQALAKRSGQYEGSTHSPELDDFWPAVLDAYGVAEQAHLWPAQKLLDYGNDILGSLRPGMVYVGGTDPGRWIPELLNETSGGEPHIIVTQNAFADGRYLEFMQTLYGDRFAALTKDDSKRAFDEYTADVQKRLQHDQQFPDEPKQVRPGESAQMVDGRIQISGQVSVMAISERLLQMLMEKNPELSFAIEQSFPFKSTYASATLTGPIMELGVQDGPAALTRERAAQSVDYWRTAAEQLLSDPQATDSSDVRKSYSKLASNQGALLLERGFTAEAEQTFRFAVDIAPSSPEAVFSYVNLLVAQKRVEDAIPAVERAISLSEGAEGWATANNPRRESEARQFRNLLDELNRMVKN